MGTRSQPITPFQEGQNTNDHKGDAPKVPVHFKMSKQRNAGQPDALAQVLGTPVRDIRDTQHFLKKSVASGGRHYQPEPWGTLKGRPPISGTKATDYKSHSSRPGANPLGNHSNRKGDNPMGSPTGHKGSNPLGSPTNRKGDNPLGRAMNKVGTKSGYSNFRPHGGGKNA